MIANSHFVTDRQHHEIASEDCKAGEQVVFEIVNHIIKFAHSVLQQNQLLRKYLKIFAGQKTQVTFNEINDLQEQKPIRNTLFVEADLGEPNALLVDSLLPISADIDESNPFRNCSQRKGPLLTESQVSIKKKIKEEFVTNYEKLQITEASQEEGIVKEMRKLQEEKISKMQKQVKDRERRGRAQQKEKKGQKEQKFSYDYSGQVILVKNDGKANLVSKVIQGDALAKGIITKEAAQAVPTTVQSTKLRQEKKLLLGKRRDDIEFSEVKSLADGVKTTLGVKYCFEGKILEEKRRVMTTFELKKSLSQRRLSKEEFARIKDMGYQLKEIPKVQNGESIKKKEFSQEKKTTMRKRREQSIIVRNEALREKLLQKLNQPQVERQGEEQKEQKAQEKLNTIDSYNLQYLRTGGSMQNSTSREYFGMKGILPKIIHTGMGRSMPKGRERLKDANLIVRQIRKKFEQKLRV